VKKSSLEEVLEQLYAVREEVRGAIEASVSAVLQFDAIIEKLEDERDQKLCKLNGQDILAVFGKVLEILPSIAKLLEQLRSER